MSDTAAESAKEVVSILRRWSDVDNTPAQAEALATNFISRLLTDRDKTITEQAAEIEQLKQQLDRRVKCRECGQRFLDGRTECSHCGGYCVKVITGDFETKE